MTAGRALPRLAWILFGLALASVPVALALSVAANGKGIDNAISVMVLLPFCAVGSLLASRRPEHPIGWLLLAIGLLAGVGYLTDAYVIYAQQGHGSLPAVASVAAIAENAWFLAFSLVPLTLLLFPDGRPPSPRWRVVGAAAVALGAITVIVGFDPGPLDDYPKIVNPFGVAALGGVVGALEQIGLVLFLFSLLGSALCVVVRFRRSRGVERLQLSWLVFAVIGCGTVWVVMAAWPGDGTVKDVLWLGAVLFLMAIPVSIGVAILRYRLYDIERVISKTLVFAALTVVLGAAYVGLVLAGQWVFSSVAGGSDLAIAVSTLVVAALFLPLRARVQRFVDRRFYRRRYDAQRTLESFGARLREQVELETLTGDLRGAVAETMQPAHVSVWLRERSA